MRILITGFVVFAIWSLFTVWLYVNKLEPAINKPVTVQLIPEAQVSITDSVMQVTVTEPKDLIIYFEFDDARFMPDDQTDSLFDEFKTWLNNSPESMLAITGHTDHTGPTEYNQTLGMKRAEVVRKYFESKELASDKMIIGSRGEDMPAADNDSEEGKAKNRRTVITIK